MFIVQEVTTIASDKTSSCPKGVKVTTVVGRGHSDIAMVNVFLRRCVCTHIAHTCDPSNTHESDLYRAELLRITFVL